MDKLEIRLPCCHRTVYPPENAGSYWRSCRRCGRRFHLVVERTKKGVWVVTITSEEEERLLRVLSNTNYSED